MMLRIYFLLHGAAKADTTGHTTDQSYTILAKSCTVIRWNYGWLFIYANLCCIFNYQHHGKFFTKFLRPTVFAWPSHGATEPVE